MRLLLTVCIAVRLTGFIDQPASAEFVQGTMHIAFPCRFMAQPTDAEFACLRHHFRLFPVYCVADGWGVCVRCDWCARFVTVIASKTVAS